MNEKEESSERNTDKLIIFSDGSSAENPAADGDAFQTNFEDDEIDPIPVQRKRRGLKTAHEIGYKLYDILKKIEKKSEGEVRREWEGEEGREKHGGQGRTKKGTFVYVKPKQKSKKDLIFLGKIKNQLKGLVEGEEPQVQILLEAIRRASELLFEMED